MELIKKAQQALTKAYAPYSGFRVGAAVLSKEGRIYTGCNVENASYGLSCCAERIAVFKAISEGEKDLVAIALVGEQEEYLVPCGACRQVLAEFNLQMRVFMGNAQGEYQEKSLAELLPDSFKLQKERK